MNVPIDKLSYQLVLPKDMPLYANTLLNFNGFSGDGIRTETDDFFWWNFT